MPCECPDELRDKSLWKDHTWAEEGFAPPAPFDLIEMESGEVLPRTYTREELLPYLEYCRQKCQETIGAMSNEQAYQSFCEGNRDICQWRDGRERATI